MIRRSTLFLSITKIIPTSLFPHMEEDLQCTQFFWESCSQDEGMMEEFRQALFYTRLELETTFASAKEDIARRDSELVRIKDRLLRIIAERDEALSLSQNLHLENLVLQQQLSRSQDSPTQQSPISESPGGDEEETAVGGGRREQSPLPQRQREVDFEELAAGMPLPEIGKLLQAVTDAGPTLQTLMLAGPLPQWQHPPPWLDSAQIPPVTTIPNKRGIETNTNDG